MSLLAKDFELHLILGDPCSQIISYSITKIEVTLRGHCIYLIQQCYLHILMLIGISSTKGHLSTYLHRHCYYEAVMVVLVVQ